MQLKLFQKEQFNRGVTGGWIGNKIADKFTKASRRLPQNSPKAVKNKTKYLGFDKEIPKERYISPGKRQRIIDSLINCEINVILTWSVNCVISSNNT